MITQALRFSWACTEPSTMLAAWIDEVSSLATSAADLPGGGSWLVVAMAKVHGVSCSRSSTTVSLCISGVNITHAAGM